MRKDTIQTPIAFYGFGRKGARRAQDKKTPQQPGSLLRIRPSKEAHRATLLVSQVGSCPEPPCAAEQGSTHHGLGLLKQQRTDSH
jgi:hypothetical protein